MTLICRTGKPPLWFSGLLPREYLCLCDPLPLLCPSRSGLYLIASLFPSLIPYRQEFPGGSDGEETSCSAGHLGLILGSRRSPGEGNGNPLRCSCLKIPWTEVPEALSLWDHKESDTAEQLTLSAHNTTHTTGIKYKTAVLMCLIILALHTNISLSHSFLLFIASFTCVSQTLLIRSKTQQHIS